VPAALLAAVLLTAPVFPATTPAQVIALASRPTAPAFVVTYDVVNRVTERMPPYRVTSARYGVRFQLRSDHPRGGGSSWLGYRAAARPQAYACISDTAHPAECTAEPVAVALAFGFMIPVQVDAREFRPLVAGGGVVRQRMHLGRRVSCLYAPKDRRQLCVGRSGVPTVIIGRRDSAVADSLRLTATARDVRPPAPIEPAED
jgi:hypothetical protein